MIKKSFHIDIAEIKDFYTIERVEGDQINLDITRITVEEAKEIVQCLQEIINDIDPPSAAYYPSPMAYIPAPTLPFPNDGVISAPQPREQTIIYKETNDDGTALCKPQ